MVKVAAAGPAANLLMAAAWALILAISARISGSADDESLVSTMAAYGVYMNLLLALFNLLPIPPLDGGRVLTNLLPAGGARNLLERAERWGFLIVVVLLVTHALDPLFTMLREVVFVQLLPRIAGSV
jgi:Zn-dependent protease